MWGLWGSWPEDDDAAGREVGEDDLVSGRGRWAAQPQQVAGGHREVLPQSHHVAHHPGDVLGVALVAVRGPQLGPRLQQHLV